METNRSGEPGDRLPPRQPASVDVSALRQSLLTKEKWKAGTIFVPFQFGGPQFKSSQEKLIEKTIESCTFKAAFSGVAGFGIGALLGIFSASVGPDLSMTPEPQKFVFKEYLKEMKGKIMSHGKSFAVIGLMFSFTECTIESVSRWRCSTGAANRNQRSLSLSLSPSIVENLTGPTERWPAA